MNIPETLFSLCGDERVFDPNCELIESGIMDSLAWIEFFSLLEENGIGLQPTEVTREELSTPEKLSGLLEKYKRGHK